jgi:signal transduction histidine kinase
MTERLQDALEAQREFVANASHQLRTPLTGLRLRLEAAADASPDAGVRDELFAAEDEVVRLAGLLSNLLVLAREGQEPPEPEPVDLERKAVKARERWQGEAAATGHEIRLDGEPGVRVMASPEDVGIILDNLIENALKYTEKGGEVLVRWGRRDGAGLISVCDEGPGLAAGEHERVLDRFARGAGASAAGTGLGLAIVSSLARRWAGAVELRDRDPRGLCAEVTMPLPALNQPPSSLG